VDPYLKTKYEILSIVVKVCNIQFDYSCIYTVPRKYFIFSVSIKLTKNLSRDYRHWRIQKDLWERLATQIRNQNTQKNIFIYFVYFS